jgi:putative transposase
MVELITNDPGKTSPEIPQSLDEPARDGARRMIADALKAEVEEYLQRHCHDRDGQGHAQVVRNGRAKERTLTMGAGVVKLRAPRVSDRRTGQ